MSVSTFSPDSGTTGASPPPLGLQRARLHLATALRAAARRRRWPLLVTIAFVGSGMAFMLAWDPVVRHMAFWDTGGDLWGIFRGAHFVAWGYPGGIYEPANGVLAAPAMEVLLAPVALLSSQLGLTESFPPFFLAHPTAALLLQPVELVLTATTLFAADRLGERFGLAAGRRGVLCVSAAIVLWPVAAVWGHAEDALALTFALYAFDALFDGRWTRCGWLLGFGIAFQPYVGLVLPILVAASPAGRRLGLLARSAALSVVLVAIAFAGNPSDTYRAVVDQPTPPSVNHATPWSALAPVVSKGKVLVEKGIVPRPGKAHAVTAVSSTLHQAEMVAGGPGRLLDLVLVVGLGLLVWRRPQRPGGLAWIAALALASRCWFEPAMTPYYLAAPLVVGLVVAAVRGWRRLAAAGVLAVGVTVFSYEHLGPWTWWLPVLAMTAAVLVLAYPEGGLDWGRAPSGGGALGRGARRATAADGMVPPPEPGLPPGPRVASAECVRGRTEAAGA